MRISTMLLGTLGLADVYLGLSTDPKPTAAAGSRFYETDTFRWYVSAGRAWSLTRGGA